MSREDAYRYNAFISYRRTPHDIQVAREVQQSLEHFRIPTDLQMQTGMERIDRIFRDTDELELSADLSGRLESALASSEFLIVICSPEYSQSPWCLHELESFIRMRGHDHVLCVLSAGDPPSVFPEALLHRTREATAEDGSTVTLEDAVEPVACDYRGNLRKARRTELPRLAAAMLGCSYDDLVMRRERYRRRRMTAIISAATIAASLAIAYLIWSNAQISGNYRQALISESRLLASEALEALDNQDRLTAMTNALYALQGGDPNRPITAEAQFALSRSTYAYETPSSLVETWRVDLNSDITDFFLSRDGEYLVCMDETGEFYTYGLNTHQLAAQFRVQDTGVPQSPKEGKEGELLCYAGREAVSADFRTGAVNWREPLIYGSLGAVARSPQGNLIAMTDTQLILVMNDEREPYAGFRRPDSERYYMTGILWSPDGKQIAVQLQQFLQESESMRYAVGLFSVDTSEFTLLEGEYSRIDLFRFDEDGILYVLGDERIGESERYQGTTVLIPIPFQVRAYRDSELLWSQDLSCHTLSDQASLAFVYQPEKQLLLSFGSAVYLLEEDGSLRGYLDIRSDLVALLNSTDVSADYISREGELGTLWPVSRISRASKTFQADIQRAESVPGRELDDESYVILASGNLSIYEYVSDQNVRLMEGDGFPYRPDGFVRDGDYGMMLSYHKALFYDLAAGRQISHLEIPDDDVWRLLTAMDGNAYALRFHGEEGALSVLRFHLSDGQKTGEWELPLHDYFCENGLIHTPFSHSEVLMLSEIYASPSPFAVNGDMLYAHDTSSNRIWRLHLTDGELTELSFPLPEEAESIRFVYEENGFPLASPLMVSPDERYIFTAGTDPESGTRQALLLGLSDDTVMLLPGTPQDLSSVVFSVDDTGVCDAVLFSGANELYTCGLDGSLLSVRRWTGDQPVSFTIHDGCAFFVYPDATLSIERGGEVLRRIPLTLTSDLRISAVNGRMVRFHFIGNRLYLTCGNELNVVELQNDSLTPVYAAGMVLDLPDDDGRMLLFSSVPPLEVSPEFPHSEEVLIEENGIESTVTMKLMYLAEVFEYSPAELAERAQQQLNHFLPESYIEQ